jgi:hypothetical protein
MSSADHTTLRSSIDSMTTQDARQEHPEDVHTVADRLARACKAAGLGAEVLAPTRVRAFLPKANAHLAEIITIMPDRDETLSLFWSWGERIGPATEIDRAVTAIKRVVTPPAHSTF